MKNFKILVLCFIATLTLNTNAQTKSTLFTIPKAATVNAADMKEDWNPVVQNIEMPAPDGKGEKNKLKAIKDSMSLVYPKKHIASNQKSKMPAPPAPFLGQNLQGNLYNSSVPNDNDIAISNGNKIVSVQNSTVFKYDMDTWTSLGYVSLTAFASSIFAASTDACGG